jgi:uncharacterized protein (DUF433 family)
MINYKSIITAEFVGRCSKPRISGMHIAVYDMLTYLGSGMTHEQILHDFPSLTEDDISTCLSYAPDVNTFLLDKVDEELLVLH